MELYLTIALIYSAIITVCFIASRCNAGDLFKIKTGLETENRTLKDKVHNGSGELQQWDDQSGNDYHLKTTVDKQNAEKNAADLADECGALRDAIETEKSRTRAVEKQLDQQAKTIQEKDTAINKLMADLEQSQKNDTPKDPETGKFTKKKPAKKTAKKAVKKATKKKK